MLKSISKAKESLQALQTEINKLKDVPHFPNDTFQSISSKFHLFFGDFQEVENTVNEQATDLKFLLPEDINFLEMKEDSSAVIGQGSFGLVYKTKLMGTPVAVKVSQTENDSTFSKEINILRSLHHDNIIAYRGSGIYQSDTFVVMEYIEETLHSYIHSRRSGDEGGLSAFLTWHITKQIGSALVYLHKHDVTHRDIKPDNILLDLSPVYPKPKLCDFGQTWHFGKTNQKLGPRNVRYVSPEEEETFEHSKRCDRFSFGVVVLETRTTYRPFKGIDSMYLSESDKLVKVSEPHSSKTFWMVKDIKFSDRVVDGEIGEIIKKCCDCSLKKDLADIMKEYYEKENPFKADETKGEFFTCGFLTNTNIFVVDSVVPEIAPSKKEVIFPSYLKENLICEVDLKPVKEDYIPKDEKLSEEYCENLKKYKQLAMEKVIDDNQVLALKEIVTDREGDKETQKITLKFIVSTYCHHRAMRDIWKKFDEVKKNKIVMNKLAVDEYYSTSFGLHVAILTNEGDGKKKFVFTQRSTRPGVASPGAFTCGAVESCSVNDFKEKPSPQDKTAQVSLIKTAARGLHEELGLELSEEETDAIHLNTTYLKFDNHEWGICGFVDLTHEKIHEKNRMNFQRLNAAFTSGPKDRFEHNRIYGVDFDLRTMVEWIREHHIIMASSGKIAVFSVLKTHFGTAEVTAEFMKYM